MRIRALLAMAACSSLSAAVGCAQILGVDKDYEDVGSASPVGAGGSNAGSSDASGGSSIAGTSGAGGASAGKGGISGASGQAGATSGHAGSSGAGGAAGIGGASGTGGAGHGGASGASGSGGAKAGASGVGGSSGASAGSSAAGGANGGSSGSGGSGGATGCGGTSMAMCGASCVDTDTNANDCGMCNHPCSGATSICVAGSCVACAKDKDCPSMVCESAICKSDNTCEYQPKAPSSACSIAGSDASECDGAGNCVECLASETGCHDNAPSTCNAGKWVSGTACAGTSMNSGGNTFASPVCNADACRTITQVVAGDGFTCALLGDATVRCWGRNDAGQLGIVSGSIATPTDIGLTSVQAITAGQAHACALLMDGSVKCWGTSTDGQTGVMSPTSIPPTTVAGLGSPVTKLVAGDRHTCAIVNKAVWCWGANDTSQLGTTGGSSATPAEPIGATNVSLLALGAGFTCYLRTNNSQVYCFGANDHGQLGDGSTGNPNGTPTPVQIGAIGGPTGAVIAIAAGGSHACVLMQSTPSTLACWGRGADGELGVGTPADHDTPVKAKVGDLFLQNTLAGLVAGATDTAVCAGQGSATELFTWGNGAHGQLGLGNTNTPVETPTDAGQLMAYEPMAMGATHTCYLVSKGVAAKPSNLYCMGTNTYGELGTPMSGDVTMPTAVQW